MDHSNKFVMKPLITVLTLIVFSMALSRPAADWPQWRGPQRNGVSQETGLLKEWPKDGPKLNWKVTDTGKGYSTPAVVGDRLYLLGNEGLENEFVEALLVKDGKKGWATRLGKVGNPGRRPTFPAARSTPTAEHEVLYCLGSNRDLSCVEPTA